jgi:hypothetical protein
MPAGVLAVLLGWSAAMQLNDPDPLWWVAGYSVLALVSAAAAANWQLRPFNWAVLTVSFVWSMSLMPAVVELFLHHPPGDLMSGMSPDRPYVERSREALGLLIGVVATGYALWLGRADAARVDLHPER